MPTFKKIPTKYKEIGGVAIAGFFIFADVGILTASKIAERLTTLSNKNKLPAYGCVTIKGKKYYYCLYGVKNDPTIYTK